MQRSLLEYLLAHGLEDLHDVFAAEDIDALMVSNLSDDDLKEIGLKLGQRKRFRAAFPNPTAPAAEHSRMPAERRQLTVVFCDLVGSTNLATMLDPEDLRDVITKYLDCAVATMKAHGGFPAYTQGDGLMVYFGYPVAQEDDPVRAIRAAMATVEAVQKLDTLAPEPLNVRIGVATGRVVVGDMSGDTAAPQDFVVGETPNLAARMQSLAKPGEVVVAGETQFLASGAFDFEARGSVTVKGFAEPKPTFTVNAETAGKSRFDVRAVDGVQPIFGRDLELQELSDLWASVQAGKGSICIIKGPPGIGKSRLLHGLYSVAQRPAVEWQCASHLTNRALHPMAAELEREAGIARNDPIDVRQEKARGLIAASDAMTDKDLPWVASLVGAPMAQDAELDAQFRARMTLDLLVRRLEGLCASGPIVAVLEDAHWADPTTLEFMDQISKRISNVPILLMLTVRPEFEPTGALDKASMLLELPPLSADAGVSLISNIGGDRDLPVTLIQKIIEKTDGIPLFVEELTKSILDAVPDGAAMTADKLGSVNIPATLQDSLMSRLDRIGPAKEIAQLGAVIGREFTVPMLKAIANEDADVDSAIRRLLDSELLMKNSLSGADYVSFNHALVQDTAYNSMLRSKRQEVHLALAKAMLGAHSAFGAQEPETIARHCEFGGLTNEAIQYWIAAGQEAVARTANVAAVNYLESALRLLMTQPDSDDRNRIELGLQMTLAAALMSSVGWGSDAVEKIAMRAETLAAELQDNQTLFGATWIRWTYYFLSGRMAEALHSARNIRAMAEAGPPGMPTLAAAHALSFTHYSRGELHACIEAVDWGLQHRDLETDRAMLPVFQLASGNALHTIAACAYWVLGEDDKAEENRRKTDEISAELGHIPNRTQAMLVSSYSLMFARDWDRLEALMTEMRVVADENGLLFWTVMCDAYLAVVQMGRGSVEEGLALLQGASEAIRALGAVLTLSQFEICAADALVTHGHPEKALDRLAAITEDAHDREERLLWSEYLRVKGEATCMLGRRDDGLRYLELALKDARERELPPLIKRAEDSLKAAKANDFVA